MTQAAVKGLGSLHSEGGAAERLARDNMMPGQLRIGCAMGVKFADGIEVVRSQAQAAAA